MITFVIVSFGREYIKYKEALIRSIKTNVSHARIKDIELEYHTTSMHSANHIKLKTWYDNIEGDCILIDADTIVIDDVSEVFQLPHDLIYTKRYSNRRIPFNSGVVFVKESGKPIIEKWIEIDTQMYKDKKYHLKWNRKYFGFNQSSFGCLLESHPEFNIGHVDSAVYNSCDRQDWMQNFNRSKIVHVKSELRISMEKNKSYYPQIENRIKKYYL